MPQSITADDSGTRLPCRAILRQPFHYLSVAQESHLFGELLYVRDGLPCGATRSRNALGFPRI